MSNAFGIGGGGGGGDITASGSGTVNTLAKFDVVATTIKDSSVTDDGTTVSSTEPINSATGFRIGGAAANNAVLLGNGTNFVSSAAPLPSAAGGVANAFFTVSGPAASAKTFTFQNASSNVPALVGASTTGGLLTFSDTSGTVLTNLADVAVGQVLTSGGVGTIPAFSAAPVLGVAISQAGTLGLAKGVAGGAVWTLASAATSNWTETSQAVAPAQGDLLVYTNATGSRGSVVDVATGSVLVSGGVGAVPTYSASPTITTSVTSAAFISSTASVASAGQLRLANADAIKWRNNAGGADIALAKTGAASGQFPADSLDISGFGGLKVPQGSAAAPAITFATTSFGIESGAVGEGEFVNNGGTITHAFNHINNGDVAISSTGQFAFSSGTPTLQGYDLILRRRGAANLNFGDVDAASPVSQTLSVQGSRGGTDTNVAGGNLTIVSGLGTGNAASSTITLQVPAVGSTGTTQETATTVATFGATTTVQPTADSTSAFGFKKAGAGAVYATLDSSNARLRIGDATVPAQTLDVVGKFQVNSSGLPVTSNALTTAGQGFPVIVGITSQKTESGADANLLTVTTPAAGQYEIDFNMAVSAQNTATIGWTATWTDSNAAAQAPTNLALSQTGVAAPALTFTAATNGNYYGSIVVDVNGSANIVVKVTFAGTSFTGKASASVKRII